MHGNVWEWVQDSWHADYNGAPPDGSSWESESVEDRVIRGGDWDCSVRTANCFSAIRWHFESGYHKDYTFMSDIGFRLVMDL
jgi:formylglycine-generating enzyme required for sulfatase activity